MTEPQGTVMWMIMPLAFAFLHGKRTGYLVPIGPNNRPHEGLVGLINDITRQELALIINSYSGFGFLHSEITSLGLKGETRKST